MGVSVSMLNDAPTAAGRAAAAAGTALRTSFTWLLVEPCCPRREIVLGTIRKLPFSARRCFFSAPAGSSALLCSIFSKTRMTSSEMLTHAKSIS